MSEVAVVIGTDGLARCPWGASTPEYQRYHDEEWGRPVGDDIRILEKLCLEGFQSGLSWLTILRKREGFRRAFAFFDPGPGGSIRRIGRGTIAPGPVDRPPSRQDPRHRRKCPSHPGPARARDLIGRIGLAT